MHPNCSDICPGNGLFTGSTTTFCREPSASELQDGMNIDSHLEEKSDSDEDAMQVDETIRLSLTSNSSTRAFMEHRSVTPSSTTNSVLDLNVDFDDKERAPISACQTFRLIYVPDPTRALTQEREKNDLAYIKTTITEQELNCITHLTNSVHVLRWKGDTGDDNRECTVLMQEWVNWFFALFYFV
jgi:hypothetical protein